MPKRKDPLYDGAIYHIILRGNNRSYIFEKDSDKRYFQQLLLHCKKGIPFFLYHYCIMGNHFHMLIQINHANDLPQIMKRINQSYTNHWKRTRGFIGLLWQGRYKRFPVERDSYFQSCCAYIELNPVRAGMEKNAWDYKWSSARHYVLGTKDPLVDESLEMLDGFTQRESPPSLYKDLFSEGDLSGNYLDHAFFKKSVSNFSPWEKAPGLVR